MADVVIRYVGLPKPYNERCKDWDEGGPFTPGMLLVISPDGMLTPNIQQLAAIRPFGEISKSIPSVNVPPSVNPNHLSVVQRRLEVPAMYLSVSLYIHYLASMDGRTTPARKRRNQAQAQTLGFCACAQ
ncbi:hypothetical protein F5B20DRAFT_578204 [Whalleya microplaca]|nr:hypothetical protein F5B20DRAFT_578204 [Whalleya microplaca]